MNEYLSIPPLRAELLPSPLDDAVVEELAQLAARMFQYMWLRLDITPVRDHLLQRLACAPARFDRLALLYEQDPRAFIRTVALPPPHYLPDLAHVELYDMIGRILAREEPPDIRDFWEAMLWANLPSSVYNRLHNLMYWSTRSLSPHEMLVEAFNEPLPFD